MYKKKLAVRALTAIAAGALLASNMTAAFAGTTAAAAQVVDKNEVKQDTLDGESEEISEETEAELPEESEEQTEENTEENEEESEEKSSEASKDVTEEETETEAKTEIETETEPEEMIRTEEAESRTLIAEEKTNSTILVKTYFKDEDGKTVLQPVAIGIKDASDVDEFSNAVALWLEGKRPGEFTYEVKEAPAQDEDGRYSATVVLTKKEEKPSTKAVWLNYVDSDGKCILSMPIDVPYGDTEVNVDENEDVQKHIPAGYRLVSEGYVAIENDKENGLQLNVEVAETAYQTTTAQVTLLLDGTPVGSVEIEDASVYDKEAFKAQINEKIADRNLEVKGALQDGGWYGDVYKLTVNVMEKEPEEKPSERTPVKTYFVDTEGNPVLEPITIGVNNIDDADEFNNAVKLWVESKRPGEFTYEVKVEPVQGEKGLYNATVVLTKKSVASEKANVTVYFKTEDMADVAELGENGVQQFDSVDLKHIDAFKQQVEGYVRAHGYEVVNMGTPTADNAHIAVIVKNAETSAPSEKVDVTAYFKTEDMVDVAELGENGVQQFDSVDLKHIDAFKQQVEGYVRAHGYEVVNMGTPTADNAHIAVIVKGDETPAPSEKVTIEITFVDAAGNVIGTGTATVDKDATTVRADQINGLPAGYEFVGDVFDITGETASALVKKTETPAPEQQDAKLIVKLMYGNTQIGEDQVFTANGPVGQSYVFTKDNAKVEIPSKYSSTYYFTGTLSDTTVAYGETKTVTLALSKRNTGNGGGSGSSGGGGGTAVSTGASGTLAGGAWKLDEKGWWYQYTNSTYAKNGWYTLEWQDRLDWYYFDANGYLVSGWYTDANGVKYYLHPLHDGRFGYMYTGWNKVDGTWQFFNDDTQNGVYGALVQDMPVPAELANQ